MEISNSRNKVHVLYSSGLNEGVALLTGCGAAQALKQNMEKRDIVRH